MTEKELYILQKDIYWLLSQKMNGVPPILQKMIMEGIYSRFQSNAEKYDWELSMIDKQQEKENEQNQEIESKD